MANEEARIDLRHNRNWWLLWAGQSISITGDYVFTTTIVLWIATKISDGQPWAPVAVSGALVAAAAPALLVGPFAGVFIDRWNRRRVMLITDLCRSLLIFLLFLLPVLGNRLAPAPKIVIIYAVLVAVECFSQFFNPARFAIVGAVVNESDRPQAGSLFQVSGSIASIIGPPIAAPLLFALGVQWALLVNALTFLISYAGIQAMRLPGDEEGGSAGGSYGQQLRAGFKFFVHSRVLLALTIGLIVATLGTEAINALNVFFVTSNLHVSARWLGVLDAGVGGGALLGSLVAGAIARKFGSSRVFWLGLIISGLFLFAYSRASSLSTGIILIACTGAVVAVVNVALTPLLLDSTPRDMTGRVLAIIQPLQQLSAIVAMSLTGFLASTVLRRFHLNVLGAGFGSYDTVYGIAAMLIVVAGLGVMRPLRDETRETESHQKEAEDSVTA